MLDHEGFGPTGIRKAHTLLAVPAAVPGRDYAAVIAASVLWGTSFPAMALALGQGRDAIDPFLLTAVRLGLAALLSLAVLAATRRLHPALFRSRWVWILGALNALAFVLQHIGVSWNGSAAKTALLVNVNLVFVALLAVRMFGDRLTAARSLALVFALSGLLALTTRLDPAFFTQQEFRGDVFILLSSLAWTPYILYTKVAVKEHPPVDLACGLLIVTAILLLPTLLVADLRTPVPAGGWWGIAYLGLAVTVLPILLYTYTMKRVSATTVTILTLIEVLLGAALGVLLLGEAFVAAQVAGAALLLIGIALAVKAESAARALDAAATPP